MALWQLLEIVRESQLSAEAGAGGVAHLAKLYGQGEVEDYDDTVLKWIEETDPDFDESGYLIDENGERI